MNQLRTLGSASGRYFPTKQRTVHQHVAFLKVHKTGSTTAQGIFLRYGLHKNLTFVVPNNKSWYPNIIALNDSVIPGYNIIPPPVGKTYDILCFHVVYNRLAFEDVMPNDTKYIGIVREPFLQFDSTIRYFRFGEDHGVAQYIRLFLKNPKLYMKKMDQLGSTFINNRMAFEYGFPSSLFHSFDMLAVKQYLEKLDKEFHVVIVNEYMDESVILLRRVLNWDLKDILFVNLNVNPNRHDLNQVGLKEIRLYRQYAKLDYELYNFFVKRLWQQIYSYGEDILEEISYFKLLRKHLQNFCSSVDKSFLKVEESSWSSSFSVTKDDCIEMQEGEFWYLRNIMKHQYSNGTQN
ncbi:galactose-3-O-sulfotransferase 3-like [Ostrea edulis]|uniref:galactose-3-O-sulfotransferase 3-like n=1 Tax=Ostrea edulis TaxID=37623 RepID=UPI002094884C|nr:galactose-3-O-sulfotransferase 3-like [Ostrea edulis]